MKKKPLTISMMGRRGGLSRSSAKSEAARKNGLKGGRPVVKVNEHKVVVVNARLHKDEPIYSEDQKFNTMTNGHSDADPEDLPI